LHKPAESAIFCAIFLLMAVAGIAGFDIVFFMIWKGLLWCKDTMREGRFPNKFIRIRIGQDFRIYRIVV
jgi:hypothetical protein